MVDFPLEDDFAPTAETLSTTELWRGAIFGLNEDRVQMAPGEPALRRQYLSHGGAVAVVPLRAGERGPEVLVIRQYRAAVKANLWEIPAGLLDHPGEDPLAAAARELREEVQLRADRWEPLMETFASPGSTSELLRFYLAQDLHQDEDASFVLEGEEAHLLRRWVPLDVLLDGVLSGRLHSPTLALGIFAAARRDTPI